MFEGWGLTMEEWGGSRIIGERPDRHGSDSLFILSASVSVSVAWQDESMTSTNYIALTRDLARRMITADTVLTV